VTNDTRSSSIQLCVEGLVESHLGGPPEFGKSSNQVHEPLDSRARLNIWGVQVAAGMADRLCLCPVRYNKKITLLKKADACVLESKNERGKEDVSGWGRK
jgi:hypothetical protein